MPIITLTTDFGTRDGYVGAVKGVISRLAPAVTIVDLAHDVPRGDIPHAAWIVANSTLEFPTGTIHLVVVDPGVGGARPSVIARVPAAPPRGAQMYVGPDNGVFAYLPVDKAWAIDVTSLPRISPTFHGRDVFARVAASIAKQQNEHYGAPVTLTGKLPWGAGGHIVHVDQFGNLISDVGSEVGARGVRIGGHHIPIVRTYEDVQPGAPLAYIGSAGTLEVAVRDGRADTQLNLKRGETITIDHEGPYR